VQGLYRACRNLAADAGLIQATRRKTARATAGIQYRFSVEVGPLQKMRIAQLAPLAESVPPKLYGGTERVVSWLTEELVGLGHEVTLFASADSVTAARLVPAWPRALRLSRPRPDPGAPSAALLECYFGTADVSPTRRCFSPQASGKAAAQSTAMTQNACPPMPA
jgi:hypothetical protein